MAIPKGRSIGEEVHPDTEQLPIFVEGEGEARIDGQTSPVAADDLVLVHAGMRHDLVNTGDSGLRLISVYTPPSTRRERCTGPRRRQRQPRATSG